MARETGRRPESAQPLAANRNAWIHVAEGEVTINGTKLSGGDAAAVSEEDTLNIVGDQTVAGAVVRPELKQRRQSDFPVVSQTFNQN